MTCTISEWYGRTGNNLQQISNAIYFCKTNGINFTCPEHQLVNKFHLNFGNEKNYNSRFFYYNGFERDFNCNEYELNKARRSIFLEYIIPNLRLSQPFSFGEDTLVIHLRGGDIFNVSKPHPAYVQNPLSFYVTIMAKYKNVVLVTEPGEQNPVVCELKKHKKVVHYSSTVDRDFYTIMQAENLALSGVGTFAVAAAMCSTNIRKIYCTNLYLQEHLNAKMFNESEVKVEEHILKDYIHIGEWEASPAQCKKMLTYNYSTFNNE